MNQVTLTPSLKTDIENLIQRFHQPQRAPAPAGNFAAPILFNADIPGNQESLTLVGRAIVTLNNVLTSTQSMEFASINWIRNALSSLRATVDVLKARIDEEFQTTIDLLCAGETSLKRRELIFSLNVARQKLDNIRKNHYNHLYELFIYCAISTHIPEVIDTIAESHQKIQAEINKLGEVNIPTAIQRVYNAVNAISISFSCADPTSQITLTEPLLATLTILDSSGGHLEIIEANPGDLGNALALLLGCFKDQDFPLQKNSVEKIASLLVKSGAELENILPRMHTLNETPLGLSINFGLFNLAFLLVKSGANVNHKNSNRDTPLHLLAKRKGAIDVLQAIFAKNPNSMHKIFWEKPPFMWLSNSAAKKSEASD